MERGTHELSGPLESESEQRRQGIARLAFQLMCNDMLDEALAGKRSVENAGETIQAMRPMILGEQG
ncbi:hypothetical protein GTC6_05477 [Gordonia terrae C-6]|uniref:Uncharacterized protein n=1 Tax=Gordonia terrae C-6 TaxID=1316928 RepID=R7YCU0_9ACTN|nr:hypothetical protein [Gordonia terrae]EON33792.1 hypothetical protein GTC6_05477 [Gordonia terrae C-6]